jgi:hypothetical protein
MRQGAGLADVFLSEPYGTAVDCGRSIVAPARVVTLDSVSGEAILSTYSGTGNLDIADTAMESRLAIRRLDGFPARLP